jgi:hypothetical protein
MTSCYGFEMELERLLAGSFPEPGTEIEIRQIFAADVGSDRLGLGVRLEGSEIHFEYPTAVLVGRKAAPARANDAE